MDFLCFPSQNLPKSVLNRAPWPLTNQQVIATATCSWGWFNKLIYAESQRLSKEHPWKQDEYYAQTTCCYSLHHSFRNHYIKIRKQIRMQLFRLQLEASYLQWSFFLTVDKSSSFTYNWSLFGYNFSFFAYSWSYFAYSGKARLVRASRDCKQRSSTVSKKTPTVSKKASP